MKTCIRFGVEVEDVSDVIEKEENFYSNQAHQDLFALGINDYKQNGTFVDIGCSFPRETNNTYLLEQLGWSGFSVDIRDFEERWKNHRVNKFTPADATKLDYRKIFSDKFPTKIIDYLSYDVDEASNDVLPLIPFDEYQFNVITIEHDLCRFGPIYKEIQHKTLIDNGYVCVVENVFLMDPKRQVRGPFEDWWVPYSTWEKVGKHLVGTYSDDALKYFNFHSDREVVLKKRRQNEQPI
jgi:hypothetical protein